MSEKSYQQIEKEALEALAASDLSAKMKQWRQPNDSPPNQPGNGKRWILFVLLLLIGGAAWLFWPPTAPPVPAPALPAPVPQPATETPPSQSPVQPAPMAEKKEAVRPLALLNKYYKPDFAAEQRGGDGSVAQSALQSAREAIAAHQYNKAPELLAQVPASHQVDADYLLAHALFGMNRFEQAAPVFRALKGSARYGDAAQWYEALSLLPAYDKKKAELLKILTAISSDKNHTFQREAQSLLQELPQ